MFLDLYLDPPDLNADEPIEMTYEIASVNKDSIIVQLDFDCLECISSVSIPTQILSYILFLKFRMMQTSLL